MSGHPNAEDISEILKMIERLDVLGNEIARLRSELESKQSHLKEANEEYAKIKTAIVPCLQKMDVDSSGNFGWESRIISFLSIFKNQVKKSVLR